MANHLSGNGLYDVVHSSMHYISRAAGMLGNVAMSVAGRQEARLPTPTEKLVSALDSLVDRYNSAALSNHYSFSGIGDKFYFTEPNEKIKRLSVFHFSWLAGHQEDARTIKYVISVEPVRPDELSSRLHSYVDEYIVYDDGLVERYMKTRRVEPTLSRHNINRAERHHTVRSEAKSRLRQRLEGDVYVSDVKLNELAELISSM